MKKAHKYLLFVGGDLVWTRAIRVKLRRLGAQVVTAHSLAELLRLPVHPEPDLVVVDEGLGEGLNGALATGVRGRWPRTPLIIAAAEVDRVVRASGVCTVSPVDEQSLQETISDLLPGAFDEPAKNGGPDPALVLCVDDDSLFLDSLNRLLTRRGYRVARFSDAAQALDAVDALSPRLAIIDVRMPGLDGLEVTRRLRARFQDRVPVVLLTALGSDRDMAAGYAEGASYYLTKPCDPRKVVNIVDYFAGDLGESDRDALEARL